jgi:hypothetical protein
MSVSMSASVYVRSGTTSYSASGSESTISPILIYIRCLLVLIDLFHN